MKKKTWWFSSIAACLALVGGVVGTGVVAQSQYRHLHHEPGYTAAPARPVVEAARLQHPVLADDALRERLNALAQAQSLGTFGAQVTTAEGTTLLEQRATEGLRPASTTKVLTAAAAIYELGWEDRIRTQVFQSQADPGTVVLVAAGDVWLTDEQMADLAEQLRAAGIHPHTVVVDVSAWQGERILEGWDEKDIDAGYVAPLEPAMLNGARIGASTGDVPRSHTPAYDVAANLAEKLGAATVRVGSSEVKAQASASVESPTLRDRISAMMVDSDNVMAEAIGREVALHRGKAASAAGATAAVLEVLGERGFDTAGVSLHDNSGLSVDNRITPLLLNQIMQDAVHRPQLRSLITTLPVAAATGTLQYRFGDSPARGYVRAKTGTLDYTSGLAGMVTGKSGRIYTFGLIANDADVAASRGALDALVTALYEDAADDAAAGPADAA